MALEFQKIEMGIAQKEFTILEREADIERLQIEIGQQKERLIELKTKEG